MTQFWQILIDGFAISSLYALGATGFTLIFGVTGVLNLSHGAIMVAAAVAAWAASGNFGAGAYVGAIFGIVVALLLSLATYYLIVRRLQLSRAVRDLLSDPARRRAMGDAARTFHAAHQGAVQRLWSWLQPQVAAAIANVAREATLPDRD